MEGKRWLVVWILGLASFGCRERNPYHCPDGIECGRCESSGECEAPTPLCNEATMTCVECLEGAQCAASRPICSPENTCVECLEDAHCPSGLCLGGSSCVDPADVAHLGGAAAADNGVCSRDMPCKTLIHALTLGRKHIKITGEVINPMVATIDRRTIVIHGGPGAKLTRTGSGFVLAIRHESDVTISDLEIVGGPSGDAIEISDLPGPMVSLTRVKVQAPGGDGIHAGNGKVVLTDSEVSNCSVAGLNITGTGSLELIGSRVFDNTQDGVKGMGANASILLRRARIYGNAGTAGVYTTNMDMVTIDASVIADNTGSSGGVSILGPFRIQNSIIVRNGSTTSTTGGLVLNSASAAFEFNTVADNTASGVGVAGVSCLTTGMRLSSSILTGNAVGPLCVVDYSLTATTGAPTGTNKTGEPMFFDVAGGPDAPGFFRIGAASAARDAADLGATLAVDIDGDPRVDARRDIGADEVAPGVMPASSASPGAR